MTPDATFPQAPVEAASIVTPAGRIVLTVDDGLSSLGDGAPDSLQLLPRGGRVASYRAGVLEGTLTLGELIPKVPDGMAIASCVAAVWRVRAREPCSILRFTCECRDLSPIAHGGPNSGEGLDALTWELPRWVVSVGTEDGEYLSERARLHDNMPRELAQQLCLASVEYLPNGMRVPLTHVPAEDVVQIHFIAAWAPRSPDENDVNAVSPWYAVDQDPAWVLAQLTRETV